LLNQTSLSAYSFRHFYFGRGSNLTFFAYTLFRFGQAAIACGIIPPRVPYNYCMTLYDCDVFRIHGSILSVIFLSFVIISRSKQIFHSKHDYSPTNLIVSPQHVAFVFAGSARSFVSPYVHKTIKHNLIDSFCPHDNMCKYDVFVRVSSNDNNHVGANSKGTLSIAPSDLRTVISSVIKVLSPSSQSVGRLFTEYFEIGTNEEIRSMIEYAKQHPTTEMKHKVYRELDLRRYSMYFNRWKAYDMALRQERLMGANYVRCTSLIITPSMWMKCASCILFNSS